MQTLPEPSTPAEVAERARAVIRRREYVVQRTVAERPVRERLDSALRHIRELEAEVSRLTQLLARAEADAAREREIWVTINGIKTVVANRFGVPIKEMIGRGRRAEVVLPRQIIAYLARELTPCSLPEIGRKLGDRDHTTVLHAVRKIEKLEADGGGVAQIIADVREALTGSRTRQ